MLHVKLIFVELVSTLLELVLLLLASEETASSWCLLLEARGGLESTAGTEATSTKGGGSLLGATELALRVLSKESHSYLFFCVL